PYRSRRTDRHRGGICGRSLDGRAGCGMSASRTALLLHELTQRDSLVSTSVQSRPPAPGGCLRSSCSRGAPRLCVACLRSCQREMQVRPDGATCSTLFVGLERQPEPELPRKSKLTCALDYDHAEACGHRASPRGACC